MAKKTFKKKTEQEQKKTRVFPNKDLKLSEKVLVRLDHRTEIYVEKPYNIEQLRKKYIKPLKKL